MSIDFTLPPELEAHQTAEARGVPRDGVRMLVSRGSSGEISHHRFRDLPRLLLPGDLLVVNTSATLPAQVRVSPGLAVHFSGPRPDGSWLTELRLVQGKTTVPNGRGYPGQRLSPARGGGPDPAGKGNCPAVAGPAVRGSGAVSTALRHSHPVLVRAAGLAAGVLPDGVRPREPGSAEMPTPAARSPRAWSPHWPPAAC